MKPFILSILVFASYFSLSQSVSVNIISPFQNQVVDSILNISVTASSANGIAEVTAEVGTRQTTLMLNVQNNNYTGIISLSGLRLDSVYTLLVVATDHLNNQQNASKSFIYDLPPILIVEYPVIAANADPYLRVKARCIDSGNCILNVRAYYDADFDEGLFSSDNFNNSVDSIFNFGTGTSFVTIIISATDNHQNYTADTIIVYPAISPYLRKIFTGNGNILDFNFNKILTDSNQVRTITDINTGQSKIIPYTKLNTYGGSYKLTPYGAMLGGGLDTLYDWNNDSLYSLGRINSLESLIVSGNFASWSNGKLLYRRNLQNLTNILVSSNAGNQWNDLTEHGLVAYWDDTYNIVKFENDGYSTITTNAGNKWNYYPVTDGTNFVFVKGDPCCSNQKYSLFLNDGQTESKISDFGSQQPAQKTHYQVNNKWIAFVQFDGLSSKSIWLMDSVGNSSKITTAGVIELLNKKGDIAFAGGLYKKSTGQIIHHPISGKSYFMDSTWYRVIGNTVYKIETDSLSNYLTNSTINLLKDSLYQFKHSDFVDNFKGALKLRYIKITGLPTHGYLTLNGDPYIVDAVIANDTLSNLDINNLVYHPNLNQAPGVDSITWYGSNGINFTSSGAVIKIKITPFVSVADGNWNNPAIWANNIVPPPGADVVIKTNVVGNTSTICNSLRVISPGSLTVNTGIDITVLH